MDTNIQQQITHPFGYDTKKWNHVSQNSRSFTSIKVQDPKDEEYWTLTAGMFQEVFEPKPKETYGYYTLNTTTRKITAMDTNKLKGFIIDPVAFAYDFGARMYDARLGRWLSLDPLQAKYPMLSPYNFCSNNPIIYKDIDGEDYILVIDHKTKTISIVANFYVTEGEAASKQAAISGTKVWNEANGKFKFVVGYGDKKVDYKIKFNLNVIEVKNSVESANKDAGGNTFEVNNTLVNQQEIQSKSKLDGFTKNGKNIIVRSNPNQYFTEEHEIGHTLGLDHFLASGFMVTGGTGLNIFPNENVQPNYVQQIFKNNKFSVSPPFLLGLDDRFAKPTASGKKEEINIENKPEDFDSGEVELCNKPKFTPTAP